MKNVLYIEIDSDSDQPIKIGKPQEIKQPETDAETAEMIKNDMSCCLEAMCSLISMADVNGYGKKEEYVQASINRLTDFLASTTTPQQPTEDPNKE